MAEFVKDEEVDEKPSNQYLDNLRYAISGRCTQPGCLVGSKAGAICHNFNNQLATECLEQTQIRMFRPGSLISK